MALVTGIFPSCEPGDIEQALANVPGLDMASVKVVTKQSVTPAMDESDLEFIDVRTEVDSDDYVSEDMRRGTGVMADSGGTSVPGLGTPNRNLSEFSSRRTALNYLGGIGVSRDVAENYNEAVDEGRCVVALEGDSATADALRTAGFRNVRVH